MNKNTKILISTIVIAISFIAIAILGLNLTTMRGTRSADITTFTGWVDKDNGIWKDSNGDCRQTSSGTGAAASTSQKDAVVSCGGGDTVGIDWRENVVYDERTEPGVLVSCPIDQNTNQGNYVQPTMVSLSHFRLKEISGDGVTGYEILGTDTYWCWACGGNKISDACAAKLRAAGNISWYPYNGEQGANIIDFNPPVTYTTEQIINMNHPNNSIYTGISIEGLDPTPSAKKIDKPSTASNCKSGLVYNTQNQTLVSNTSPTGYTYNVTQGKDAKDYTITASLASGYTWSDGSTGTVTFTCKINKATPTITLTPTSGTVTVGGTVKFNEKANVAGKFKNTSSDTGKATVSPAESASEVAANTNAEVTVTGKAAGNANITVLFTPTDTNNYNTITSTSNGGKTYAVTVSSPTPGKIDKPTTANSCISGLKYNKQNQTLVNTPPSGYTYNITQGKDAKTYTITATLASGYTWSDGSTGTAQFNCKIDKATPVITLSSTSGDVSIGDELVFEEKANAAGKFKNTPVDTSKIAVSPAQSANEIPENTNDRVTITGKDDGSTTITVEFTPTDTNNYNSASATVYVNVGSISIPHSSCTNTYAITFKNSDNKYSKTCEACDGKLSNDCINDLDNNSGCSKWIYNGDQILASQLNYHNFSSNATLNCKVDKEDEGSIVNPKTGTTAVVIAWIVGISAIIYAAWYFKKVLENK